MTLAFTLIELVVVIAVIAILSAVSVAAYMGVITSARNSTALEEATQLKTALKLGSTNSNTYTINEVGTFTATSGSKGITFSKITALTEVKTTDDNAATTADTSWSEANVVNAISVIYTTMTNGNGVSSYFSVYSENSTLPAIQITSASFTSSTEESNGNTVTDGSKTLKDNLLTTFKYYATNGAAAQLVDLTK